jgi:trafficking protein particle complex subunit 8
VRYATRSVLLLVEYLQAVGQYSEAHWALMKAHFQVGARGAEQGSSRCSWFRRALLALLALLLDSPLNCGQIMIADSTLMSFLALFIQEENLRAGLLLEQAAHCLLSQSPPHVRKFAFHLVLAGLRYDMCAQKGLAQRAYK